MIKKLKYLFVLWLLSLIPINFWYSNYWVERPFDISFRQYYSLWVNNFTWFDVFLKSHWNFYTFSNSSFDWKYLYYFDIDWDTFHRFTFFWSNSWLDSWIWLYWWFSWWWDYSNYNVRWQWYFQDVCLIEWFDNPCFIRNWVWSNDSWIITVQHSTGWDFSFLYDEYPDLLNPDTFYFVSDMVPWFGWTELSACFWYIESDLSLCYSTTMLWYLWLLDKNLLSSMDAVTFDNSLFLDSPFWSPDSWWWSSNWSTPVSVQCTKWLALRWFEKNWYTSNLCYWWLNDFTINTWLDLDVLPVAWTWLDVEEIWFNTADLYQWGVTWTGMGYNDWYLYWNHMYRLYKYQLYPNNPFLNTPYVLYTYFDFVNMYWDITSRSVIDYCDLKLYTADYTKQYTWSLQSEICTVSNIVWSDLIVWSWDVEMWINIFWNTWSDITNWSDFIKKYWAVLKENFNQASDNSSWVLPLYIQLALIWIILFRFMSH